MIDLFQCRRNYNELCYWWSRKIDAVTGAGVEETQYDDSDELIIKNTPTGSFYAKEYGREYKNPTTTAGVFMYEATIVTIKSPDNLTGIKANDIVKYQDEYWRVSEINYQKARMQQSEFAKAENVSKYWYIRLRK